MVHQVRCTQAANLQEYTTTCRVPLAPGFAPGAFHSSTGQQPNFHSLKITSRRRATSASQLFPAPQ